jgi:hypothetical protein
MRIAIVGAGRIGGTAGRSWSRAGHDVLIRFSRHPDLLAARAAELGDHVSPAAPAHAVAEADVVMLAVPWDGIDQALAEAGPLAGRVVIDTTNRFGAGPGPLDGQTVAQFDSARMPGARYVRAFNTLTSGFQADGSRRRGDERAVLFPVRRLPRGQANGLHADRRRRVRSRRPGLERGRRGHGGPLPAGFGLRRGVPAAGRPRCGRGGPPRPGDPADPPY